MGAAGSGAGEDTLTDPAPAPLPTRPGFMIASPSTATAPVVRMERVSKTYLSARPPGLWRRRSGEQELQVVVNFSLAVRPGEFVSIIGPSGCGKTTVLFLLAGLRAPSSGTIDICGRAPQEAVRAGLSSVIFQQPVLFEWLTAEANVLLPLRLRDPQWWLWPWRRPRYLPTARQLLRTVDLEPFAHYYPDKLSGGMQQRLAIARALTLDPRVLLLDEPFGALDAQTRMLLQDELLALWQRRPTTVVLVTHDMAEAVYLADRVLVMSPRPGRIIEEVPIPLPRPRDQSVRRSARFAELVEEVWACLRGFVRL